MLKTHKKINLLRYIKYINITSFLSILTEHIFRLSASCSVSRKKEKQGQL